MTWVDDRVAPGRLEDVRAFVNTLDQARGPEALRQPADARDWLADHGFGPRGLRVGAGGLERTVALREALRALLLANAGEALDAGAVTTVNEAAERAGLAPRLAEDGSPRLEGSATGLDAAHGAVLTVAFDAMAAGTWPRLRACPACGWAFYDVSRNRSSRWCDMRICGNRSKAQALRDRRSAAR